MFLAFAIVLQLLSPAHAAGAGSSSGSEQTLNQSIATLNEQISEGRDLDKALEQQAALRAQIQKEITSAEVIKAANLIKSYSFIVRSGIKAAFMQQAQNDWNLKALRTSLELTVPAEIYNRAMLLTELPSELIPVRTTKENVVLSVTDEMMISAGLKVMLRRLNDKNYEIAARCLLGYSFAVNYANAVSVSRERSKDDLTALAAMSQKPFCMKEDLVSVVRRQIDTRLSRTKNGVVRAELLNQMPEVISALPPVIRAASENLIRMGDEKVIVSENLVRVLVTPEYITERLNDDATNVLSLAQVAKLTEATKQLNVSFLRGDEKFLTIFDAQLLTDIKGLAKQLRSPLKLNDAEIERRLRLAQVIYLRDAMNSNIKRLTSSQLAQQATEALNISLAQALVASMIDVVPVVMTGLTEVHTKAVETMAEAAATRHLNSLTSIGQYNQWLNQTITKVQAAASDEKIANLQADGYAKAIREAANKIEATTGEQIADEKLPYKSQFIFKMLEGEIDKSSSRVQQWFKYVEKAGAYRDSVRAQSEVEAYIRKSMKNPESCEVKALTVTDKVGIFWENNLKSFFSGNAPVAPTTLDQNAIDCQRFVRLSTYGHLRNTQGAVDDMSEVVKALDTYWSVDNRNTMLAYYRKLLRLETLDQYRLLELVVQDEKTLAQLLNSTGGNAQLDSAISTTKTNIISNMNELLNAADLKGLAPVIARTNLLDVAFQGQSNLLSPSQTQSGLLSQSRGIEQLLFEQKIADLADLKKERDSRYDLTFALWKYHSDVKDRMKISLEAQRTQWNTIYGKGTESILTVIGIVVARRLIVPMATPFKAQGPSYWVQQKMTEYMSANKYIGRGYFTFLTAIFGADAAVQHYVGIPALMELEARDNRYAYSETENGGGILLNAANQWSNSLENGALIEDAKFRRFWGVALTALPLLPALAPAFGRMFEGLWTNPLARTDLYWRRLHAKDPEFLARQLNTLKKVKERRLRRLANYNVAELQALGLNPSTAPMELLNLENLQKALKTAEQSTNPLIKTRARVAYRKLVHDLYEEMGAYSAGSDYVNGIYSQIYGGPKNTQYINELVAEFEKVVLGL